MDDDPPRLELMAEILAAAGYAVAAEGSGRRAVKAATLWRPDLVLVDDGMPDLDGEAVVRQLKADPTTRAIPVVALSGGMGADPMMAAGCIGHIPKPVDPRRLVGLVRAFLQQTVARHEERTDAR